MKRIKILFSLCLIFIVLTSATITGSATNINVTVDGVVLNFDQPPVIKDGNTLVPVAKIFEALGAKVDWKGETQTIIGTKGSTIVKLQIDSKDATVNGQAISLDTPAIIINGRTMVPARFIAESMGADVEWDGNSKTVVISTTSNNSSDKIYPFGLTDNEIKEAIKIGENGFSYAREYEDKHYTLKPNPSEYNVFIDNTQIMTPYHFIIRQSAMKSASYNTYSFKDAKDFTDTYSWGEGLDIEVVYLGASIDSHKHVKAVLKQGDKIIHPTSSVGQNKLANTTNNWPNFPAYQALLSFSFSNTLSDQKIDFSKKAQLIVIHAPEMETVYEIDFSKIK